MGLSRTNPASNATRKTAVKFSVISMDCSFSSPPIGRARNAIIESEKKKAIIIAKHNDKTITISRFRNSIKCSDIPSKNSLKSVEDSS